MGLAVAGLVVLAVLLLWRAVVLGEVFYFSDLHRYSFPQMESFVRIVASGSWPFWDPYTGFGQPLLADPSAEILYPASVLKLILRPGPYYTCFALFHLCFAGVGASFLARRFEVSPAGSFVAGAVFMLSGPLVSYVDKPHHLAGAAWIPWVLVAADRAFASGRLRDAVVWGGAAGVQALAGSADMCVMTWLMLGVDLALRIDWRAPLVRGHLRLVGSGAVAGLVGLCLGAALWAPTAAEALGSLRASLPAEMRTHWSVHPIHMLQVLVPLWPNRLPFDRGLAAEIFDGRISFLLSLYLGATTLGLALAAFVPGIDRRRAWLLIVGVVATLTALGPHGPVYGILTTLLPPLRSLRYPMKVMVLPALTVGVLSGMGFDVWRSGAGLPRRRWLGLVAAPLLVAALILGALAFAGGPGVDRFAMPLIQSGVPGDPKAALGAAARSLAMVALLCLAALACALLRLWRSDRAPLAAAAVAGLVIVDLLSAHRSLNATAPRQLLAYRPPTLEAIHQQDLSRLYVYEYEMVIGGTRHLKEAGPEEMAAVLREWPYPFGEVISTRDVLYPPQTCVWGLYGSYDLDARGLYPGPLARLAALLREVEGTPGHLRLLQLGAVSQVVALHTEGFEDLSPLRTFKTISPYPIHLYRVPDPLPRAYAVSGARVASGSEAYRGLLAPDFDPGREVLLDAGRPQAPDPAFTGSVRVAELKPDRVRLEAELSRPGYVVLVDGLDPGWSAMVDGHEAEVLRANVCFRAVALGAGRHVIEQRYRPPGLLLGASLSAAALVALALSASAPRTSS
jgi:hypothetical protein